MDMMDHSCVGISLAAFETGANVSYFKPKLMGTRHHKMSMGELGSGWRERRVLGSCKLPMNPDMKEEPHLSGVFCEGQEGLIDPGPISWRARTWLVQFWSGCHIWCGQTKAGSSADEAAKQLTKYCFFTTSQKVIISCDCSFFSRRVSVLHAHGLRHEGITHKCLD